MMIPSSVGEVWGIAYESTYRDTGADISRGTDFKKDGPDVEVVYYPDTRCLCFQPHPEYGNEICTKFFFRVLTRALLHRKVKITKDTKIQGTA
jgi:hypothetical protein